MECSPEHVYLLPAPCKKICNFRQKGAITLNITNLDYLPFMCPSHTDINTCLKFKSNTSGRQKFISNMSKTFDGQTDGWTDAGQKSNPKVFAMLKSSDTRNSLHVFINKDT